MKMADQRAVVVEFESTDAAKAAFTSDVYRPIVLLGDVKRDVRIRRVRMTRNLPYCRLLFEFVRF